MTTAKPAPSRDLEKFYAIGSKHYRARYEIVGVYCVRFQAWEIDDWDDGPIPAAAGDALVLGEVKWDGCTNHSPVGGDTRHACYREDLVNFGVLMGRIYDQAAAILPIGHIIDDAEPVVEDGPFPWETP